MTVFHCRSSSMILSNTIKLITNRTKALTSWRFFSALQLSIAIPCRRTIVSVSQRVPVLWSYRFEAFITCVKFSSLSGDKFDNRDNNLKTEESGQDQQSSEDPPGYKDVAIIVSSARVMAITNKALSLGTTKTNEAFFDGCIRLNNKRIAKKKDQAKEGDTIDVILDISESEVTLQRIRILVDEGTTSKGSEKFYIRRWKVLKLPLKSS